MRARRRRCSAGLFLEFPFFDDYNKRFGRGEGRRPLAWESDAGEIEVFKREVIMRHIMQEEARAFPFVQYLHNRRVFSGRDFSPAPDAEEGGSDAESAAAD